MLALGELLNALNNAISMVTRRVAVTGSVVLVGCWVATELILKRYSPPWRGADGTEQRIRKLGVQPRLFLIGILMLLWFPALTEWIRGKSSQYPTPSSHQQTRTLHTKPKDGAVGMVTDPRGVPIAGAKVSAEGGETTTTDENGAFFIALRCRAKGKEHQSVA
jgi:hypothetical protein